MTQPDAFQLDAPCEHDAWLRQLTRRLVSSDEDARELAQETWRQALTQRPDPPRPLRAWLTVVARRTARRLALRDRRRVDREKRELPPVPLPGPDQLFEHAEAIRILATALTEIREPFRSTLPCTTNKGLPRPTLRGGLTSLKGPSVGDSRKGVGCSTTGSTPTLERETNCWQS